MLLKNPSLIKRCLLSRGFATAAPSVNDVLDVVVIGGGPGGYVAAIRAAQKGLKTACIEKYPTLGGTCLNVGCIPSKTLLYNSHLYELARKDFGNRGIIVPDVKMDLQKLHEHKSSIIKSLTGGIKGLFKKNGVLGITGEGSFLSPTEILVRQGSEEKVIKTKNVIIATGSEAAKIPGIDIDGEQIVSSTGALGFSTVPKSLVVVGGGVIGLELGMVWSRLGSEVTIIEALPTLGGGQLDHEVAQFLERYANKHVTLELQCRLKSCNRTSNSVIVEYNTVDDDTRVKRIESDKVLLSIGRRPYTKGLNLSKAGISTDKHGRIPVSERLETSAKNIYAIGDVIRGPMLAHKAEEEALAVVDDLIDNGSGHVNYDAIPGVIYTHPEVATLGLTEDQCRDEQRNYRAAKFPFLANSRAKAQGDMEGFVKIIVEEDTDKIIGVHIVGPNAGEMIAEAALAMEYGASSEDIARTCHAHPTLSEAFKEACMAAHFKPIHF